MTKRTYTDDEIAGALRTFIKSGSINGRPDLQKECLRRIPQFAAANGLAEALSMIIKACQRKEYRNQLTHAQISDIAVAALTKAGL